MSAPRIVLVLGMHRSGTSVAARALTALGVNLGENLLPPTRQNPKGFFEDTAFLRINNALLASLGLKWYSLEEIPPEFLARPDSERLGRQARRLLESRMALYRSFGFKDPRTCRLLPFWCAMLNRMTSNVACVVVARNPMAVARSLHRRNKFGLEYALALWHVHMKALVGPIHVGWKKVTVEYDQLLEYPEGQLQRIAASLNLAPPRRPAVEAFCSTFLDIALRHNAPAALNGGPADVREIWNELRRQSLVN